DVIEGRIAVPQCEGIGASKIRAQAEPGEVLTCGQDLPFFDIDSRQRDSGERLAEHSEDRADAAADLQEPGTRLEHGPVEDQLLAPMLRLRQESILLTALIAVDVTVRHDVIPRT